MKKQIEISTICLITKDNKILLGKKKRGLGKGYWNGLGGRLEKGESIKRCAIREAFEEAKIKINKLTLVGKILFKSKLFKKDLLVYFYKVNNFQGKPTETLEMKPSWFNFKKIPFQKMWPDDKFWMPIFLKGGGFTGKVEFGKNHKILKNTIRKTNEKIAS